MASEDIMNNNVSVICIKSMVLGYKKMSYYVQCSVTSSIGNAFTMHIL